MFIITEDLEDHLGKQQWTTGLMKTNLKIAVDMPVFGRGDRLTH